jgi:hypothetical protein
MSLPRMIVRRCPACCVPWAATRPPGDGGNPHSTLEGRLLAAQQGTVAAPLLLAHCRTWHSFQIHNKIDSKRWKIVSDQKANHLILMCSALIKKKTKISSYIRKFRMEQLQSHIWLMASSYMGIYLPISSYIRKPFLIYNCATAPH